MLDDDASPEITAAERLVEQARAVFADQRPRSAELLGDVSHVWVRVALQSCKRLMPCHR